MSRVALVSATLVAIAVATGCGNSIAPSTAAAPPKQQPTVAEPGSLPPTAIAPPQIVQSGLDGARNVVAFSARLDSPDQGDLYTVGIDGQDLRRVTSSPANEYSQSWAPDGKSLAFRSEPAGTRPGGASDIAIVTLATLEVRFLTSDAALGNWSPAWSPDGKWIAYYSGGGGHTGLYLVRPDGSDSHRILEGDAEYPAWSPDGRRLAFMSLGFPQGRSSNDYDIYVVDVDGGELTRLTNLQGEDGWPAWSHDGTRIAYTRRTTENGPDKIRVMSIDGTGDRAISDVSDSVSYSYPDWSPSDRFIAYSAYPQDESSTATGGMFVSRSDGSMTLGMILADGVQPIWQPLP